MDPVKLPEDMVAATWKIPPESRDLAAGFLFKQRDMLTTTAAQGRDLLAQLSAEITACEMSVARIDAWLLTFGYAAPDKPPEPEGS